ncbi:MAG: hypothetical protein HC890_10200 [Chloroflexaceae bacterium]|nr:hypothetical protein [Chloroflexaceae bacterium]
MGSACSPLYSPPISGKAWKGVRVTLNNAIQVSETDGDGQFYALVDLGAGSNNFNARGGLTLGVDTTDVNTGDSSGERIQVDLEDALVAGQEQSTAISRGQPWVTSPGLSTIALGNTKSCPRHWLPAPLPRTLSSRKSPPWLAMKIPCWWPPTMS